MKKTSHLLRLLNLCLRCSALACKFIFILFTAKQLQSSEVGLYSLIVATIAYSIYPLGLEYYLYNSRLIMSSDKSEWGALIKNQATLHLYLYFIILPLFLLIFITGFLPWKIAPWFFLLLPLEHINQEMMRLLIAMSKPLAASISLFIRQGLWVIFTVLLAYTSQLTISMSFILSAWLASSIFSFIFSALVIYSLPISGWHLAIRWADIRKGLKITRIMLLSTLSINLIFVIDKYLFRYLQGSEALGAYSLFIMLASALISVADAGIFSFAYPKIVIAVNKKNIPLIKNNIKSMTYQTALLCLLFFFAAHLLIHKTLEYINKTEYTEHVVLFYYLSVAVILYTLSIIPDYFLYANKKDREKAKIHIVGLLIFLSTASILSGFNAYLSIPLSMCAAFFWILLSKSISAINLFRHITKESTYPININD